MREHRKHFEQWSRYKSGKIHWRDFQRLAGPIRDQFNSYLVRGRLSGIEPTNNTAERALRPAVIYRKLSFGTQSASGSRYLERILTVSETCRLQNRNAYQFLIESMRAKFAGVAGPSLASAIKAAAEAA